MSLTVNIQELRISLPLFCPHYQPNLQLPLSSRYLRNTLSPNNCLRFPNPTHTLSTTSTTSTSSTTATSLLPINVLPSYPSLLVSSSPDELQALVGLYFHLDLIFYSAFASISHSVGAFVMMIATIKFTVTVVIEQGNLFSETTYFSELIL
jgi:hypothetical protein